MATGARPKVAINKVGQVTVDSMFSEFERTLVKFFLQVKLKFFEEADNGNSSVKKSYDLMHFLNKYSDGDWIPSQLRILLSSYEHMRNACLSSHKLWDTRRSIVGDAEMDFLKLAIHYNGNRIGGSLVDTERELEKKLTALFLSLKTTIERATAPVEAESRTTTTMVEEKMLTFVTNSLLEKCSTYRSALSNFELAFYAILVFVGFLAAEELHASKTLDPRPNGSGIAADKSKGAFGMSVTCIETEWSCVKRTGSKTFSFDLYLYLARRFNLIQDKDYMNVRSKLISHSFIENIGRCVILLSFAYRRIFCEYMYAACGYARDHLKKLEPHHFISKFVKDSLICYPNSSYRYLMLLSFISEITLTMCSESTNINHIEGYLKKAINCYHDSGMYQFEEHLKSSDNFQGLKELSDHISKAWKKVGCLASAYHKERYSSLMTELPTNEEKNEGQKDQIITPSVSTSETTGKKSKRKWKKKR